MGVGGTVTRQVRSVTLFSRTQVTINEIVERRDRAALGDWFESLSLEEVGFAMFACIRSGWPGGVSRLLGLGTDPGLAWGQVNNTPLHEAATHLAVWAVRSLLEAGAIPNAVATDGWSPLHVAVDSVGMSDDQSDNSAAEQIIGLLLEAGASADAEAEDGLTPRQLARSYGLHWVEAKF